MGSHGLGSLTPAHIQKAFKLTAEMGIAQANTGVTSAAAAEGHGIGQIN